MVYKLVIHNGLSVHVKRKSTDKGKLESLAIKLSKAHPRWTLYVVHESMFI